ncbi:N-methyltransferase [Ceraceosorus bombacis]|uniref:N-methyltransferase n=1 Tax=Ceraceosorus bombacis TaxID=401625 RepID=A0A0P1BKT7_9BASI|nr:N-methyltransferase [Ceraceosorus bombacis]
MSTDAARLQDLFEWAKSKHIWTHDGIAIKTFLTPGNESSDTHSNSTRADEGGHAGFGVYAVERHQGTTDAAQHATDDNDIDIRVWPRQVVVLTPKSAILSPRNSSLAKHIPSENFFNSDSSAGLLLSLVLLHEYLLGGESDWSGYLGSLPHGMAFPSSPCSSATHAQGAASLRKPESSSDSEDWGVPIPLLWPKESEEWSWIRNTEAGRIVERVSKDPAGSLEGMGMSLKRLDGYFQSQVLPTLQAARPGYMKRAEDHLLRSFRRAYSIVSSRAFVVDMWHGLALVPLADMFNHSSDPNMQFEADDEVCDQCGALGKCPHSEDPLPGSAYGRPSAFMPASHGPNSVDWVPPLPILAQIGADTVDMVATSAILKNEECLNSYGLLSNASLLAAYGFVLAEETEFERIGWDWRVSDERRELVTSLQLGTAPGALDLDLRYTENSADDAQRSNKRTRLSDAEANKGASNVQRSLAKSINTSGAPSVPQSFAIRQKFVRTCVHALNLRVEEAWHGVQELLNDPSEGGIMAPAATPRFPEQATLSLPVDSPFRLLAHVQPPESRPSITDPEHLGGIRSSAIAEGLESFLAPLSGHEGTSDLRQPFFVDGEGRVSVVLWRAALLAQLSAEMTANLANTTEPLQQGLVIRRGIFDAESALATFLAEDESQEGVLRTVATRDAERVERTVQALQTLVTSRLAGLRISRPEEERKALAIIDKPNASPLKFAALHAFQELAALRACLERLESVSHKLP